MSIFGSAAEASGALTALVGIVLATHGLYNMLFQRYHYRPLHRLVSLESGTLRGVWAVVLGGVLVVLGLVVVVFGVLAAVMPDSVTYARLMDLLPLPPDGLFLATDEATGETYDGRPMLLGIMGLTVLAVFQYLAPFLPSAPSQGT